MFPVDRMERRLGRDLSKFMHPILQLRLVKNSPPVRRYLRIILLSLCGCFLILSLMRPQWGFQFVATPRVGAEIMVCLDVSKSMLAEDVAPSRLERAKAELIDLLTYLDGDQVGLIAFAGRRVIQATVKEELDEKFQRSEYVQECGFVDLIIERKDLKEKICALLSILLKKNSDINNTELSDETSEINFKTTAKAS